MGGGCVCVCVFYFCELCGARASPCARPSGAFVPDDSSPNRRCSFQFFSPRAGARLPLTTLLAAMHVSFYLASLSLHMRLSPSLSPSAAPQGSLLNAAICLCPPSHPPYPSSYPFLSVSERFSEAVLMNHSSNYHVERREIPERGRKEVLIRIHL